MPIGRYCAAILCGIVSVGPGLVLAPAHPCHLGTRLSYCTCTDCHYHCPRPSLHTYVRNPSPSFCVYLLPAPLVPVPTLTLRCPWPVPVPSGLLPRPSPCLSVSPVVVNCPLQSERSFSIDKNWVLNSKKEGSSNVLMQLLSPLALSDSILVCHTASSTAVPC